MSTIVDIAKAIAKELNNVPDETFALEFEAVYKAIPAYTIKELETLRVTAVPAANTSEAATRSASRDEYTIFVGVQQKINIQTVDEDIIPLTSLVEAIQTFLKTCTLSDVPYSRFIRVENDPTYVHEHLAEKHAFTSFLTVTYRVMKA